HDALEVLEQMIGDNSVNGFHIFFPDPWPKKRHHKRRLLQRPRTNLLAQKLAPEGYLYFVTDWFEYAEFALEELNQTENLVNKYDGFAEPQEWRGQTKFERKGLNADRSITEIFFVKK
ncbi:MAG: tRNA (guanosine(46)-N7)-methyltransferase TrmB, partial [Treponema sp.]|nr:tRNA (guanosine(46)-N7)-methyltransferase TrmB [Treponema sp.]